ncbi:hypothetical protein ABD76_04045 [Paenibacillus dendritiformis]|nr:hypothetical protein [Paenibacillus dendritiformis]
MPGIGKESRIVSNEYVEKYTTSSLEWEEKISENQAQPHEGLFPGSRTGAALHRPCSRIRGRE